MSPFAPQRLLLPYDFSEIGDRCLQNACQHYLGLTPPPHIFILHVLTPLPSTDPANLWQTMPPATRQRKVQQEFEQKFPEFSQLPNLSLTTVMGDPGPEIIHFAATMAIDLIVMPSHGRRGLSRLLLGSVAETVLRGTECAVLAIK